MSQYPQQTPPADMAVQSTEWTAYCAELATSDTSTIVVSAIVAWVVGNWTLFQAIVGLTRQIHEAQSAAIDSLSHSILTRLKLFDFFINRERRLREGLVAILAGTGVLMIAIGIIAGMMLGDIDEAFSPVGLALYVVLGAFSLAYFFGGVRTHRLGKKERAELRALLPSEE